MSNKLQIKVCGLKTTAEIDRIDEVEIADYLGMIFYEKSPRYFQDIPSAHAPKAKKVGVFVNENRATILAKAMHFNLDMIQLHGSESPEFCHLLRTKIPLIKVFHLDEDFHFSFTDHYAQHVDYFLFDTASHLKGGTGVKFNWDILKNYKGSTPFFLSGGIAPEDIETIKSFKHEKLLGLDLNSRFEVEPGFKNIDSLKTFVHGINNN